MLVFGFFYLVSNEADAEFYLTNSFIVRLSGILALKDSAPLNLVFGYGIGYSDDFITQYFQSFGIPEDYRGSFLFGIIGDFGILGVIILGIIILDRMPLTLLILILLNFSIASPYFLFLAYAWRISDNSHPIASYYSSATRSKNAPLPHISH